jgi:hypothetical protein
LNEAAASLTSLQAKLDDATSYAERLAVSLHAKHYQQDAPNWKPLPDLYGILTQLDNMSTGFTRAEAAERNVQMAVEALRKIGGLDIGAPPFIETTEGYGSFAVMTARTTLDHIPKPPSQKEEDHE